MKIIDSNLLIYSANAEYSYLRELLRSPSVYISAISTVEVLGYHKIIYADKMYFEAMFRRLPQIAITDTILLQAIEFRQTKSMSAGDAIIAATAFLHNATLYTRNTKDFEFIKGMEIVNPVL
jgi:predicted nucleic acid-binding protein